MQTITLTNRNGLAFTFTPQGGIALALTVPDRKGALEDILLGPADDTYLDDSYIGALIGRVGNRVGAGRFTLDGKEYVLPLNNYLTTSAPCSLHGGQHGFDARLWNVRLFQAPEGPAAELTLLSPDGDQGYPGNLSVRVVYTLTDSNVWRIEYWALTDAPTPVSLTNHAYFNLSGDPTKPVTDHILTIFADRMTPVNDLNQVPTGAVVPVAGTPFDFLAPHAIGERIDGDPSLLAAGGYDHNYILSWTSNNPASVDTVRGGALQPCARVEHPASGRVMEVFTTQSCVQFYSGNGLGKDSVLLGKRGISYKARAGFCLETQAAPDSVNQPNFPDAVLRPGVLYHHITEHRFSAV